MDAENRERVRLANRFMDYRETSQKKRVSDAKKRLSPVVDAMITGDPEERLQCIRDVLAAGNPQVFRLLVDRLITRLIRCKEVAVQYNVIVALAMFGDRAIIAIERKLLGKCTPESRSRLSTALLAIKSAQAAQHGRRDHSSGGELA